MARRAAGCPRRKRRSVKPPDPNHEARTEPQPGAIDQPPGRSSQLLGIPGTIITKVLAAQVLAEIITRGAGSLPEDGLGLLACLKR